jgi:hypothetical protein
MQMANGCVGTQNYYVGVCWALVADEPHKSNTSNLGQCPLKAKANVRCLIFPLYDTKER